MNNYQQSEYDTDELSEISNYDTDDDISDEIIIHDINDGNNVFYYRSIIQEDGIHMDSEKINGHYYIGICKYFPRRKNLLYVDSISARTFFKYPINIILEYLKSYAVIYVERPKIHIMKLLISDDGSYYVILKTHWLRLIQRHWKSTYKKRQEMIFKRRSIESMRYFEINGRYNYGQRALPRLNGMLYVYNKR
jgi:hypothetical protein